MNLMHSHLTDHALWVRWGQGLASALRCGASNIFRAGHSSESDRPPSEHCLPRHKRPPSCTAASGAEYLGGQMGRQFNAATTRMISIQETVQQSPAAGLLFQSPPISLTKSAQVQAKAYLTKMRLALIFKWTRERESEAKSLTHLKTGKHFAP